MKTLVGAQSLRCEPQNVPNSIAFLEQNHKLSHVLGL